MNVKLTLITGALILAGAAVPFSQSLTAYADSHSIHTGVQVHTQGKVYSKGKMSGKFDLQNTTNSIQSTVNQVQSSIGTTNMTMKQVQQVLHIDIKKAQQAHHDLIDALHQYINAMQAAIRQGDTQALNIGLQGSASIESNLRQALNIQAQLPNHLDSSVATVKSLMGTHGLKGIQRVEEVAQKELAKANNLENAATQLKQLAQQINNQITKDGGTVSTTSTTHTSVNTSGTATGSVNTQGESQGAGNTTTSGRGQNQGNPISPKSEGTNDTSSSSTDSSSGLSVQGSVQGNAQGSLGTQGTQSSLQGSTNDSLHISVN